MRKLVLAGAMLVALCAFPVEATTTQPVPAVHQTAANPKPVTASPVFAKNIKSLDVSYRAHRNGFATVSKYSETVRRNRLLALGGILIFAFLTLPKNSRDVRAFYRQMISASPLPDLPDGSVSSANVQQARAVLFFYLLFLLYQIVAFPLTLGRDNIIQFSADLFFQSAILLALIWAYQRLKWGLRAKMDLWLNEKLDGMNIRWRDIRKFAVGVFIAGFAPVTLAHLTDWVDALTALGDRISGA